VESQSRLLPEFCVAIERLFPLVKIKDGVFHMQVYPLVSPHLLPPNILHLSTIANHPGILGLFDGRTVRFRMEGLLDRLTSALYLEAVTKTYAILFITRLLAVWDR
jgi:hypothetical protein